MIHHVLSFWFWFVANAPMIFAVGVAVTVAAEALTHLAVRGRLPLRQWSLSAVAGFVFLGVKSLVGYSLVVPLHQFFYQFRVTELDMGNPFTWLFVFLMRDVVSYWSHRLEHRLPWLWASHAIHHSFEEMSPSTATRVPWMENVYKLPFTLWMPLVGVDIRMVIGIDVVAALLSIVQHTEAFSAKPHGILQRFFIVPAHHRVHHGVNPAYLDKNFGAVLCIWDKAFGTFQPEIEPARYGVLGRPLDRPVDMILGKYPDLVRDLIRGLVRAAKYGARAAK